MTTTMLTRESHAGERAAAAAKPRAGVQAAGRLRRLPEAQRGGEEEEEVLDCLEAWTS